MEILSLIFSIPNKVGVSPSARRRLTAASLLAVSLFFFLTCYGRAEAQGELRGWEWQNPRPQGNVINSIRFAKDKRHGWAVGADGAILYTVNGGFEWKEQRSAANTTLYSIYVKDKSRAIISGAGGVVLTTVDGGVRWIKRNTNIKDHLFCVTFAPDDPLRAWAVGTFGAIIATTDGGITWKEQTSKTTAHLFSVSFTNKQTGIAVGARGTLLITNSGGAEWDPKAQGDNVLTGVAFTSPKRAVAVGYGGTILQTDDAGATWGALDTLVTTDLLSVSFSDDNHGWASEIGRASCRERVYVLV